MEAPMSEFLYRNSRPMGTRGKKKGEKQMQLSQLISPKSDHGTGLHILTLDNNTFSLGKT